ncbi:MAG: PAS domain-containing protein [Pseudomonadota bacterium]
MNDDERLREALLEIELLRRREAERSRESTAVLTALETLTATKDAKAGISALLKSIQTALDCAFVALFEVEGDFLVLRFPESAALPAVRWNAPILCSKGRHIVDISSTKGLRDTIPEAFEQWQSLVSMPFAEGQQRMVLAAFSPDRAAFSRSDAELLKRLATIASQAIIQRTLEQQSDFLSAVIDASPVSVAIADARDDLPLVYVNSAFTALTGYSADEVIGRNCRVLSAEDWDSDVRIAIRETLKEQTEGSFLLRNRRKSGEVFWNELRLFPIKSLDGEVTQIVATQTDATDRVNAERERDYARERMEGALSSTSEAFMIVGSGGDVRFVNEMFRDLFSFVEIEIDQPLSTFNLSQLLNAAPQDNQKAPLIVLRDKINREIKLPSGRQALLRSSPMEDGGAVISATDITQTKVNERILRQRLAAIENSQDGIAIGDVDGRVLHTNPSLLDLWNLEKESEGLGRKWTSFYGKTTQRDFAAAEAAFFAEGVWRDEATMPHPDGPQVHDVSISLVPDVGTVLIVRDVTERQQEDEERSRLRRQLDRAQMQEQLSQISAGLAHDFNNLLSAIMGSAALIDTFADIPPPAQKAAGRIKTAAERAAELVDGFMDLGLRERQAERLNLGDALLTTVDLAQVGAPAETSLTTSIYKDPIWIMASRTDLLQAVMNLVVNGLDALEGEPGEIEVVLGAPTVPDSPNDFAVGTQMDGQIYAPIRISDTGSGMTEEVRAKVLEPYFTTKGNSGSGLGLAIVVTTIKANGCLLALESEVGVGTTFTIYWPVDEPVVTHPDPMAPVLTDRRGLPLLIVDDQEEVASALGAELTAAGFEVAELNDAEAAIETILEDRDGWGCVISDYDMPHTNGGDLVARLTRDAPEVPVIIVSALARRMTDTRVKSARAVLSKPVQTDRLVATINKALNAEIEERQDADLDSGRS